MNISSGKKMKAQKIVVYGVEGIGKSELASQFPNPVFIDTEGSTDHMDVNRFDAPTSWPMLMDQINWAANPNNHNYKTLVIDTIDWAERLCSNFICINAGVDGTEDFGWGKGFNYLAEEFGRMLDALTNVTYSGSINVVLIGHAHVRSMTLPEEDGNFDKYELRLNKKVAPLPKEWADGVFFLNYKTLLDGEGSKKKATGGRRVIHTSHKTSYDAKNRYGLPEQIDFEGAPQALVQALGANVPIRADVKHKQNEPIQETKNEEPQQQKTLEQSPSVQTQSENSPNQAQETNESGVQAPQHPLFDLMNQCQVTPEQIEEFAVSKGHQPAGTPLNNFSTGYLDKIVSNWQTVLSAVKK